MTLVYLDPVSYTHLLSFSGFTFSKLSYNDGIYYTNIYIICQILVKEFRRIGAGTALSHKKENVPPMISPTGRNIFLLSISISV